MVAATAEARGWCRCMPNWVCTTADRQVPRAALFWQASLLWQAHLLWQEGLLWRAHLLWQEGLLWRAHLLWQEGLLWRAGLPRVGARSGPCYKHPGFSGKPRSRFWGRCAAQRGASPLATTSLLTTTTLLTTTIQLPQQARLPQQHRFPQHARAQRFIGAAYS